MEQRTYKFKMFFYYDDKKGLRQLGFLIYNIHGYFDGPSASNILSSIAVSRDEKFAAVGGADRIGAIHIAELRHHGNNKVCDKAREKDYR